MSQCDVAIIGGGAAGLSAALVLSRARRDVVVIDAGAASAAAIALNADLVEEDVRNAVHNCTASADAS